eukprot:TRINITY_DN7610_c0_g1_i1.p1 TRINITY_DN7610_c0_g1~~TRINITY_DN7610_c0_g1_i1.p1  ORF type:complete len:156 (-),score=18.83 TRINITY_DN7610_c0_g1_i1:231-698(-)
MDISRILAIAGLAGTTLAPLVLYELDLASKRKQYPLSITKDYGRWTMYTGVLHNFVMLSVPKVRDTASALVKAGFFGQVSTPAQFSLLWSQLFGITLSAVGFSVSRNVLETKSPKYSKALGYGLVSAGITCVSVLPISGAWLVIAQGIMMILNGN